MPSGGQVLRLGSRDSKLALYQTNWIKSQLEDAFPDITFEIVTMDTIGDRILNLTLAQIGEKSLFTKELEEALGDGRVDILVHSLKDVPTTLPDGMVLGAIGQREDPRDAVCFRSDVSAKSLSDLPPGSKVGTSAPRRISQLSRLHPHLDFISVRGSLDSRFEVLNSGRVSAIILAVAGLKRLGWADRISYALEPSECMYAVGQAAVAVECRADDADTLARLTVLSHPETTLRVIAERTFMKTFGGGCNIPVAAFSELDGRRLTLKGGVFDMKGEVSFIQTASTELPPFDEGPRSNVASYAGIVAPLIATACLQEVERLGSTIADKLVAQGAKEVVDRIRQESVVEIENGNKLPNK